MSKYDALRDRLRRSGGAVVTMSFDELADLVPGGLPASAYVHAAWWSNERGEGRHVQCRDGWAAAGYRVDGVDLARRRVVFRPA